MEFRSSGCLKPDDRNSFFSVSKVDGPVKSRKSTTNVMPVKAGIQKYQMVTKALDPGFRRGDDFLRERQF